MNAQAVFDHAGVEYEWDEDKARANEAKHGVDFMEAASVFEDDLSITVRDMDHSTPREQRFRTLGMSAVHYRVLVVIHCDQANGRIRVISARTATPAERRRYEEET